MSIAHVKSRKELVTCPYDPAHRIEAGRLPIHLMKCKRNHDSSQFQSCPFNASHVVPTDQRSHHISTCPDKAVWERSRITTVRPTINNTIDLELLSDLELPPPTENWDLEVGPYAAPGYDPEKRVGGQMFQNPATFSSMTRAQKKQHRQALNEQSGIANQGNEDEDDDEINRTITTPLKELRLPIKDETVAGSVQVLGGSRDSLQSQSSHKTFEKESEGLKSMIAISKGRGIYRFQDKSGPGLTAPGLGASNEAIKLKMRSPSQFTDCSSKVSQPRPLDITNDSGSCTSDDNGDAPVDKMKQRLQKKLKQINVLEQTKRNGAKLTEVEEKKVAEKEAILKVLEVL